jgi:hypothetical protein
MEASPREWGGFFVFRRLRCASVAWLPDIRRTFAIIDEFPKAGGLSGKSGVAASLRSGHSIDKSLTISARAMRSLHGSV